MTPGNRGLSPHGRAAWVLLRLSPLLLYSVRLGASIPHAAQNEITLKPTDNMSRDAADVPLGAAAGGGNRLVSEPAFELLFSEIVAYTGAYVAHTAASHSTDVQRISKATVAEEEDSDEDKGGGVEDDGGGVVLAPSPAAVGAGNALLPVRLPHYRQQE